MPVMEKSTDRRSLVEHRKPIFAWHGLRLELPPDWNPVKLEGDGDKGFALFADLKQPRLGLRWQTPPRRKFDADAWARRAMRDEVGKLAAEEARPHAMPAGGWAGSLIYFETDPPGRNVWVAQSTASGRLVEATHFAPRRDRALAEVVLPRLSDTPADAGERLWSVFDLSCAVPSDLKLESHRLNAGDLSLTFAARTTFNSLRRALSVRQIAVASLALQRMPLDGWMSDHQKALKKHYRPAEVTADATLDLGAGRGDAPARTRKLHRRRRFFWMRGIPREYVTYAWHDAPRDRLVIVQATDDELARRVAGTVGRLAETN
jgi:hypothetical protein